VQFQAGVTGKSHVRTRGKLGSAHRPPTLYVVNNSTRVHINDQHSGKLFLIDTGAEISVIPYSYGSRQPSDVHLTAANGTRIKTLVLDLGLSRPFTWTFEMADVSRSIIGADFLHYFGSLSTFDTSASSILPTSEQSPVQRSPHCRHALPCLPSFAPRIGTNYCRIFQT